MIPKTLKDLMTHSPIIISPEKTVHDAAKLMKEHNCGALLVGSPEHAVGIITDRDIAVRVVAEGKDPARTHLKAIMSKPLHSCDVNATPQEAAELMRTHEVRRLVVTRDGHTNGVITLTSLVQHAGSQKLSDAVLHTLLGTRRKHAPEKAYAMAVGEAGAGCENYDDFTGVF
jgi:CBS domain-containing protein